MSCSHQQNPFVLSPTLPTSSRGNETKCLYACLEENYLQNVLSPVSYYEFPDSGEFTKQQRENCTHICQNISDAEKRV